jgi:hypothetical protein
MGVHDAYEIMTNDSRRRSSWERIFGRDTLPVRGPARLQHLDPGRGPTLAYDLDARVLHPQARARLASAIAERSGEDYGRVLAGLDTGDLVPVRAGGCRLVRKSKQIF